MNKLISLSLLTCLLLAALCLASCGTNTEIEKLYAEYVGGRSEAPLKYVAPPLPDAKLSELDDDQLCDLLTEMGVEIERKEMNLIRAYVEIFEELPDYVRPMMLSWRLDNYTENRLRKAVKLYYGTMTEEKANKPMLCFMKKDQLLTELEALGVEFPRKLTNSFGFYAELRKYVFYCEAYPEDGTTVAVLRPEADGDYESLGEQISAEYYSELENAARIYHGMAPIEITQ